MEILTIQNKEGEKILHRKTSVFDFTKFTPAPKKESTEIKEKIRIDPLFIWKDHEQNYKVRGFTPKEIKDLLKKMRLTMKKASGVGLSANQVGLNLSLFIAQVENKFYAIFNPKITKSSKEKTLLEEGCLSIPDLFGQVERAKKVTLEGQDWRGKNIKIKAWGLLARVFQHEVDHLNGILFVDKAKEIYKLEREVK